MIVTQTLTESTRKRHPRSEAVPIVDSLQINLLYDDGKIVKGFILEAPNGTIFKKSVCFEKSMIIEVYIEYIDCYFDYKISMLQQ